MHFKVILKDSDPSGPEGRSSLLTNMSAALGLPEERAQEIIDSMPITLKDQASQEEANEFAKVLRELGALVFVEEDVDDELGAASVEPRFDPDYDEGLDEKLEAAVAVSKMKAARPKALVLIVFGVLAGCIMMIFASSMNDGVIPIELDQDALRRMLKSQEKIMGSGKQEETIHQVVEESWYGEIKDSDLTMQIALLTRDGKPIRSKFKLSTPFPGERTPEEIIRGQYRPWLKNAQGELSVLEEPKNVFGPTLPIEKMERLLLGVARVYFEVGGLGSRVVANASLQLNKVKQNTDREFTLAIRLVPLKRFIKQSFYLRYEKDSGYSLIVNKDITMTNRKDAEAYFEDPYKDKATVGSLTDDSEKTSAQ